VNETYSAYTNGIVTIVNAFVTVSITVHNVVKVEAEIEVGIPVILVDLLSIGEYVRPAGREPPNVTGFCEGVEFDRINSVNAEPTVRVCVDGTAGVTVTRALHT
jgi:hypothetical protein